MLASLLTQVVGFVLPVLRLYWDLLAKPTISAMLPTLLASLQLLLPEPHVEYLPCVKSWGTVLYLAPSQLSEYLRLPNTMLLCHEHARLAATPTGYY